MADGSSQTQLRFLVLGCGSIGRRHIGNLLALNAGELLAFDVRDDRRQQVASQFGIETLDTLEDGWKRCPDVVLIAVPNSLHVPLALQAAEHGCHLFIEKPLSHRLDGVDQLLEVVGKRKLVTLVGCNLRFHPGLRRVKQLLEEGAIGRVVAARVEVGQYLPDWHPGEDYRQGYSARRDLGGGVILDAIHEIDYIRWLLGEVETVTCFAGKASQLDIETEDTAAILLRFLNGALGEVHMDYVQRAYSRTCQVIGVEGTIRWDYTAGEVRSYTATTRQWQVFGQPQGWEPNQMFRDEMQHFLQCVAGVETPTLDVGEAARVLKVALTAKAAAETQQVIRLGRSQVGQKSKVVAIVQARMGSTRFPGKVLAEIAGRPMLWHVANRLGRARSLQQIVVATSTEPTDDAIANFCAQHGIHCFRGHPSDVLSRYYQAAKQFDADVVVRITADCPFIDPEVVDKLVSTYFSNEYDYVSNTLRCTYPDGLDTEVFSAAALETAWRDARLLAEREHVTPYMRTPGRFHLYSVENEVDLSPRNLRWTVDEPRDLEFVRAVYARLGRGQKHFGLGEILQLLQREPQLLEMNQAIIRNEGYYKSLAGEPPLAPQHRKLVRSQELKSKAERLIPSCTQTFSKGPTQFVQGVAPVFLQRGQGSHVWDVDGNEYIDYPLALGPIVLGYSYPAVNEAVMRQLADGTTFSLPHPLEIEVAEMLVELIPCAEMVRFGKNGSDATSGAVRVARAYTARDLIACCGYHGWQDWYIGTTPRNQGVPKAVRRLTLPFEYNNLQSLERIFAENPGQVAAVILEPVGVAEPYEGFLPRVQELTQHEGAVLIFDEVVTGFRLALGGAQEYFGVTPDLACYGKAMGNGFPIAAVVGRRELMQLFDQEFFSFTFGGEALSLAAARATIQEMREKNVIPSLWEQGQKLKDGYNVLARELGVDLHTQCTGYAPRTVLTFQDENGQEFLLLKSIFQQEVLKRGILSAGYHNICFSHSNADIDYTLRAYRAALAVLAAAIQSGAAAGYLEGPPVQEVFRRL